MTGGRTTLGGERDQRTLGGGTRARQTHSVLSHGRRFTQLMRIARRNGVLPWRRLDFTTDPERSALRTTQAEGLRRALEEAGGAFVKLGQLLSTRSDLLPVEWVEALSKLQRDVEPAPWGEVRTMLEDAFDGPLERVFTVFHETPVAAASIGQVHRAILPGGRAVAVKVLRPGIVAEVHRDVDIALRFMRFVDRTSPKARMMGSRAVAEQYADDLLRQLDFRLEARNLLALRAMQERSARASELHLPELVEALSTQDILVTEYLEGDTITAINSRRDPVPAELEPAMRTVLHAFIRQIVFDGVYHSDLHPGNIMLLPDGRPALVDFGSVGRLDLRLRETTQELLIAYLQSDTELIGDGLLSLGALRDPDDEPAFRRDISTFIAYELGPGARVDVATVDALVAVLTRYGLLVPAEFVAAFRGFAILDGALRSTVPSFDLLAESRALASEQIRDQMAPKAMMSNLTTELLAMLPGMRRLPRRVDRIGSALENGELSINIRVLADRRDRRMLSGLVRQVLLSLAGLVTGVSALVFLTASPPEVAGAIEPATAGIVLGGVSLVSLAGVAIDILLGRRR
ncbi:Protein kinase domain-containing protein [Plantibacter sp. RU18]|uniref:ABC1 kinase family protein n=2 Tax=unclassified Plantibacter TaxID=2624265 RepID=UPI0032602F2F